MATPFTPRAATDNGRTGAEEYRAAIASDIRAAMGRHQISGAALAEKLGLSAHVMREIAKGERAANTDELVAICDLLGLDFADTLAPLGARRSAAS